ncbi:hypothetical protein ACQKWADRAFT_327026 [Trichoderma austrokoningii]
MESYQTSTAEGDDDATFTVRRNGKVFYIDVSPSNFVNSPVTAKKFKSYLQVLQSGEEVIDDISDTNQQPRRVLTEHSPSDPSTSRLDDDFLNDLATWTTFYDPARIITSHENTEDALCKLPRRVLIEKGQVACFLNRSHGTIEPAQELTAYKQIHAAGLDSQVNLCHMHGVVLDDYAFLIGFLLTDVDGGRPLSNIVSRYEPNDPPPAIRRRWMGQIEAALSVLHANDVVWGDIKAENVWIDKHNDARLIDFGGGYTEGWVSKEVVGTVAGDLEGMTKLKEFLFPLID